MKVRTAKPRATPETVGPWESAILEARCGAVSTYKRAVLEERCHSWESRTSLTETTVMRNAKE